MKKYNAIDLWTGKSLCHICASFSGNEKKTTLQTAIKPAVRVPPLLHWAMLPCAGPPPPTDKHGVSHRLAHLRLTLCVQPLKVKPSLGSSALAAQRPPLRTYGEMVKKQKLRHVCRVVFGVQGLLQRYTHQYSITLLKLQTTHKFAPTIVGFLLGWEARQAGASVSCVHSHFQAHFFLVVQVQPSCSSRRWSTGQKQPFFVCCWVCCLFVSAKLIIHFKLLESRADKPQFITGTEGKAEHIPHYKGTPRLQ